MKCKSEEELSLKSTSPTGKQRFMCRPCRRDEYYLYKERKKEKTFNSSDDWNLRAMETLARISRKYG
jgi:transposase-like protein